MRLQDMASAPAELRGLVRALAREAGRRSVRRESPLDLAEGDEVILDTEMDGVRCVLIRLAHRRATEPESLNLSPREREITRMVARGYPNKTIAIVLDISTWTVSTHLRRIFAKLGVGSRAAMVARVLQLGLLETEPPA